MPQVLITGGAGFIGSHVAAHLLAAGYGYRTGDVRDCFADIGCARAALGPQVAFAEGLESWSRGSLTPPRSTGSMRRPRSWRVGGWSHERRVPE
jgi:NAD(P)-dependent dehydrogenase (short-subunit alcohol dehydrogenase family)